MLLSMRDILIIDHVKAMIDKHYKNTDEKLKIVDMGCGDGVLLYLLSRKIKNPNIEL